MRLPLLLLLLTAVTLPGCPEAPVDDRPPPSIALVSQEPAPAPTILDLRITRMERDLILTPKYGSLGIADHITGFSTAYKNYAFAGGKIYRVTSLPVWASLEEGGRVRAEILGDRIVALHPRLEKRKDTTDAE